MLCPTNVTWNLISTYICSRIFVVPPSPSPSSEDIPMTAVTSQPSVTAPVESLSTSLATSEPNIVVTYTVSGRESDWSAWVTDRYYPQGRSISIKEFSEHVKLVYEGGIEELYKTCDATAFVHPRGPVTTYVPSTINSDVVISHTYFSSTTNSDVVESTSYSFDVLLPISYN